MLTTSTLFMALPDAVMRNLSLTWLDCRETHEYPELVSAGIMRDGHTAPTTGLQRPEQRQREAGFGQELRDREWVSFLP